MRTISFEVNDDEYKMIEDEYERRKEDHPDETIELVCKRIFGAGLVMMKPDVLDRVIPEMVKKFMEAGIKEAQKDPELMKKGMDMMKKYSDMQAKEWAKDKVKK